MTIFKRFEVGGIAFYKIMSVALFIIAIILVAVIFFYKDDKKNNCLEDFQYLTPMIDCDEYENRSEKISSLEPKLNDYVKNIVEKDDRVGVWVRDLTSKRFAEVNSQSEFYLASLLKVPLLVAYYKMAEVEPNILERSITYNGLHDDGAEQLIKPEDSLVKGKSYTINELLYRAVVYSDNSAAQELTYALPDGYMNRTLKALGVHFESPTGTGKIIITPRTYANILRILYNSSYLSPYYSNEAIKLLIKTKYKSGAVSGFPEEVEIAHKFGERFYLSSSGSKYLFQLHDCGIVYFNHGLHPVLFCIMTEGDSPDKMQSYLKGIARLITVELGD